MSTIERLRGSSPALAIFAVAMTADSELILHSMRAGANEFFTWPPADEAFHSAIRRTTARREAAQGAGRRRRR
jgi:FixJ family two-component response regulator